MQLWQAGMLRRINLLEGSVSSGKTWISLVLWAFWVATMPESGLYLMTAKTLTTLRRNCLLLLQELVGEKNFTFSIPAKEGFLFGRRIILEGANDAKAEPKIRGVTLQGAYVDELTQTPEEFFAMLLSRLRLPGAKLIATTNPDRPTHWLMKNYIERAEDLDFLDVRFLLDDNTFLPREYIESIRREYTGVFYKRYILGEWAAAEGVIYPLFADDPKRYIIERAPVVQYAVIGVDFGGTGSAHSFTLTGFTPGMREAVILDELYHDNRERGRWSPEQLSDAFEGFVRKAQERYRVYEAYCDSAEQTLIEGLRTACVRARLPIQIRNAVKGRINDRIMFWSSLMAQDRFRIMQGCTATISALINAVYDGKKAEDVRLDDGTVNVDSLDSMEYSAETVMGSMIRLKR